MAEPEQQSVVNELVSALLAGTDTDVFLAEAAATAARRLGLSPPDGCSIAVERSRRPLLTARTHGLPPTPSEYGPGSPAGTVLGGGPDVVLPDLAAERRWAVPNEADGAVGSGIRSIAAVALPLEGGRAVLCCYAARPYAFEPGGIAGVRAVAAEIAKVLRLVLLLDAQANRAANLQAALESRTVVDLAAGIIMGQNGCSQQAAIDILRSVSNSRNIKIRNVAAGVVAAVSDRVSTHFDE
ncbi:GAF and ANTAR domain-containing protein [Arthrobacter sp. zg-Y769]|uniref:GAF and ANTAR domain-containing protein n=1 Tax=Arthrobacter sp. zg-Y769 TaxID=2894191 RepID=UPI001E5191F4|nr:ANTAR domain-containing protein [Arthrobacter sp. zg-Y769]MCC9205354.1 ANTAR domain-containing protein [Arthrobacter sp. zg-Y769]